MENSEAFVDELVVRMCNLGADIKCNKKNKRMYVNSTIPTESQIAAILRRIKELEQKQDAESQLELMKGYQKVIT